MKEFRVTLSLTLDKSGRTEPFYRKSSVVFENHDDRLNIYHEVSFLMLIFLNQSCHLSISGNGLFVNPDYLLTVCFKIVRMPAINIAF